MSWRRRRNPVGVAATAEELFAAGVSFERAGDLRAAERAYRRADEAGSAEAAANLGALLFERHRVRAARECLERADARGSAMGSFRLGFLLSEAGEDGEPAYRRAVDRGSTWAVSNLATILLRRGDHAGAREIYEHAVDADDPAAATEARLQIRRLDAVLAGRAEAMLEQAAALGNHRAAHDLGEMRSTRGDHAGALKAFRQAETTTDPDLRASARRRITDLTAP